MYEVPGSSQRMLAKTQGLKVDCVAYDLEDSVIPAKKGEARMNLSRFLHEPRTPGITERAVRINPVGSQWAEQDLLDMVSCIGINFPGQKLIIHSSGRRPLMHSLSLKSILP